MPIRIVIADDHPPILQGLALLLRQEPDLEVLACCRDGEEALQAVRQFRPDILILDDLMPRKDGLAVLRELRQVELPSRVILLPAANDKDNLVEAMRLGVGGVVPKETAIPLLIRCVRTVYAGEQWLDRRSIGHALETMLRREPPARKQVLQAKTKPIQIFLCHASEDRAVVLDIYKRLKARGYKPWLDQRDLLHGQLWEEEIPKAIRESDFILIFLSRNSIPKRGYVQTEFKLTLDAWMRVPQGMIHTIPVRLDDSEIPDQFSKFRWCNLNEANGFKSLLRSLRRPTIPDVPR
jgi:DNA-binding NarL/FixJ family response regulator